MTLSALYLLLGTVVAVAGMLRMLLTGDLIARLIGMNVVGIGSLLILLALGARAEEPDPVLSALVITGLVITVAFTGFGAVLIRRIESAEHADDDATGGRQ
ncbi:NADH-quinone oxidoreductase subunit K [Nesterenkonia alba]|uniref:NADH-quinone oxidoreductase subunit K n=1 Tax=Nesterenkonia alba TaxID=515814 RepID=UPI0003B4CA26|nr:NADH-quinone oxidoreductase subunit K [Nesterenkonia alba]